MTFRHGKLTEVLLADFVASPYLNSAETSQTVETAETSAFGTQDKTYIPGQNDGSMSLSGLFDGSEKAIDQLFSELTADEQAYPVTLLYDGGVKVGRSARAATVRQTSYDISSPVGDVVSLSVELQCDKGIHNALCLTDKGGVNANVEYPGADWGPGSATSRGGTGYVHVTSNGRNTATQVIIQHSADNSVWVDLATQPVSAGQVDHFVVPVAGAIDRYVRAQLTLTTGTGLVNVVVAFARN